MRVHLASIAFLIALFLFSCAGKKEEKSIYKNNIQLQAKGFKVKDAYLIFDDSIRVSQDNQARVGQHVNLEIIIDSGWKVENGRIYPGVEEEVRTSDDVHIFHEADLMEIHPGGAAAEDGWRVTIQAVVNTVDKKYDYFLVSFRIWDKKTNAEITGSYKLHIKV